MLIKELTSSQDTYFSKPFKDSLKASDLKCSIEEQRIIPTEIQWVVASICHSIKYIMLLYIHSIKMYHGRHYKYMEDMIYKLSVSVSLTLSM